MCWAISYIYWEFPSYPNKLGSICLELRDIACMGILRVRSCRPQFVDRLQIWGEHVWMLVIFGRDVLLDSFREGDGMGLSKREKEDVPVPMLATVVYVK
jgi:hypothetical protein